MGKSQTLSLRQHVGNATSEGEGAVDMIQTKKKHVAREQSNKYKPRTETGTTPYNTLQSGTPSRPADSIRQWLDLPVLLLVIVCYS